MSVSPVQQGVEPKHLMERDWRLYLGVGRLPLFGSIEENSHAFAAPFAAQLGKRLSNLGSGSSRPGRGPRKLASKFF